MLSGETFWYCLVVGWVIGRESISNKMGAFTSEKVLAFSGVEVQLPIFESTSADV